MTNIEQLSEKVFSLMKGLGLKLKIYDHQGAETTDPTAGTRFFSLTPNVMVTLDTETKNIELSKGASADESEIVPQLQKLLKRLSNEFLVNLDITVFGKAIQPKDYAYQVKNTDPVMESVNSLLLAKVEKELDYAAGMTVDAMTVSIPGSDRNQVQEVLNQLVQNGKVDTWQDRHGQQMYSKKAVAPVLESFSKMFGSKKTSRQVVETVKILVKHKKPVNEEVRGSRTRNISAIFLEQGGERFKLPHTYMPAARASARHLSKGGSLTDQVGTYINESVNKLIGLRAFESYARKNNLINESSQLVVDAVKESMDALLTDLKRLQGAKTYESAKARIIENTNSVLNEQDVTDLKELFTVKMFDQKLESVLPVVKSLVNEKEQYIRRIEESAASQIYLSREIPTSVPVLEFANEKAKLGHQISELASRITGNSELSEFVSKVGTKLAKNSQVTDFEKAILTQVLENVTISKLETQAVSESVDVESIYDKYMPKFI